MKPLFLFLLFPVWLFSQHTLTVSVAGAESSKGSISVAVYDQEEGFLEFDKVFKGASTATEEGITKLVIEDLPEGEYALAVFHDENANNELDTNFMGVPKEDVGFSNAKMKTFGPPSFKECAFKVASDLTIKVEL